MTKSRLRKIKNREGDFLFRADVFIMASIE